MAKLVVVAGGARSGKSTFAENLALKASVLPLKPIYLASATAFDEEMQDRIDRHQRQRGSQFRTIEAPHDVISSLEGVCHGGALLWDCLTIWLSNRMMAQKEDSFIETELFTIIDGLLERFSEVIVVTNEVGLGIVPESSLGRRFRDLAGRCHQGLTKRADEVYFAMMGLRLRLKPAPIEVFS